MGIASMIIGIISVILAFIPCPTAVLLFLPVIIGFVLGIVDVVLKSKRQQPKGCGIAGIVFLHQDIPGDFQRRADLTAHFLHERRKPGGRALRIPRLTGKC